MHVRTTALDLAKWIERRGGHWTVDGEPVLARSLPAPAHAASLAEALRKRPGELLVLVPDGAAFAEDAFVDMTELQGAAHMIEGQHVFQLAWVTPEGIRDSWLVAEHDRTIPSGDREETAARIVAGFRQGWPSPSIARKR
jgi:hypothetical protein